MAIQQIDAGKCIGCGVCENSCAMDVIRRDYFPSEQEKRSPCTSACPARVNMRGYIHLLKEGKIEEAIRLIREELAIPAVTGHVCFHPCEEACVRKEVDAPVNINSLERYVADYWLREKPVPAPRIHSEKVAVIGSGPAGLAAAYSLVRMGYPVTVFESESLPGGMLRTGIPEYRLPVEVLDAQIEYIRGMGVDFRTGVAFGRDLTLDALKKNEHQAVLFAIGAQLSRKIAIEGGELRGVLWGLDFLRDVKLKRRAKVGESVVVVGGGNVALDAALTAFRLGAKECRIVCLESREEMPAHEEAIETALAEGVEISVCWGPKRVAGDGGKVTGIELVCCLSVFDGGGGFMPRFDEETTLLIETDTVIFAVGESADLSVLPAEIRTDAQHIIADPATLETNLPGVFAAGVVASGPGSVVEAVASGKKAAGSIHRYLRGVKGGTENEKGEAKEPPREAIEKSRRQIAPLLPPDQRKGNFLEIKSRFDRETAEQEAQRCLGCGSRAFIRYLEDCMTCYTCERDCPEKAIHVSPEHVSRRASCWG